MAKSIKSAFDKTTAQVKLTDQRESTPLGVVLTEGQKNLLSQIAADLGTNRHRLMQYIIAEWIRGYEAGERPKMRKVTKTELDIP